MNIIDAYRRHLIGKQECISASVVKFFLFSGAFLLSRNFHVGFRDAKRSP